MRGVGRAQTRRAQQVARKWQQRDIYTYIYTVYKYPFGVGCTGKMQLLQAGLRTVQSVIHITAASTEDSAGFDSSSFLMYDSLQYI